MTTSEITTYYKVVWTKAAVAKWDRSYQCDPRHTIAAFPIDTNSPWFRDDMQRHFGTSWVLIDSAGALVARS